MDPEAGSVTRESRLKFYKATLCLAYQSFGVVYGDLSSSPLYVYKSTFSGRLRLHEEDDEILGVLSLVFWTLTLIPLCKYIIFVLGADDNGEGGPLLYIHCFAGVQSWVLLSASDASDDDISAYNSGLPRKETSRIVLLLLVLLGTSMVIGDGILTPSIIKAPSLHETFGTRNVGYLFAPILLAWLFCISVIGVYNTIYWNPHVVSALSPYYVYNFFKKAGKDGWSSLGGIVLLHHRLFLPIAFTVIVYPCLVLAYMGEAAYLSKHKEDLQKSFYKQSLVVFWPVFIIATLATMVGSQAIISGTFSVISQCRALKCFPRVKRDTDTIGNAYGLAVITVLLVTTCLMFLVIVMVWKRNILGALAFVIVFGSVELLYFSACLAKVHKGGWFPLVLSLILLSTMCIWHYGLIYSNVATGVPPMFAHFVTNFPAFHRILFLPTSGLFISRIGPPEFCLFQCVVRYGYKDQRNDTHDFENHLIETVSEFLRNGNNDGEAFRWETTNQQQSSPSDDVTASKTVRFRGVGCSKELEDLREARESGLAYMMGSTCVLACDTSSYLKKFAINIVYGFLRQNCRHPAIALGVPHTSLIEVGMVYRV
ncbi:hypothetical protein ES319_1Z210100v1 [Gossypium barbadense]|uniref:Potassium transporter n=1 Tax=Gossypium barbadense TaxID=3634 RepID=A0A5J5NA95_GOSBA|nr:hypothetical protein ES319_1Z210100v1 [Gossypium barbadense]